MCSWVTYSEVRSINSQEKVYFLLTYLLVLILHHKTAYFWIIENLSFRVLINSRVCFTSRQYSTHPMTSIFCQWTGHDSCLVNSFNDIKIALAAASSVKFKHNSFKNALVLAFIVRWSMEFLISRVGTFSKSVKFRFFLALIYKTWKNFVNHDENGKNEFITWNLLQCIYEVCLQKMNIWKMNSFCSAFWFY